MWIDLQAVSSSENRAILVEIKSYQNVQSPVESLASTLGKYLIYRAALKRTNNSLPVYLALPDIAFKSIFGEPLGLMVLEQHALSVLIYNVQTEEIVEWIHTT
ncbi:hypothetical protein HC776_01220 [bacterium]|nr:hypothetical protein [bacterium]